MTNVTAIEIKEVGKKNIKTQYTLTMENGDKVVRKSAKATYTHAVIGYRTDNKVYFASFSSSLEGAERVAKQDKEVQVFGRTEIVAL